MADPAGEGQSQTVDSLADRQDKVERKLDELIELVKGALPGGPKASGDSTSTPTTKDGSPEGGMSVEEQVQAELARRDKQAADDKRAAEHDDLKAQVAQLRETPPRPPARRATKLLGWGDGRG